MPLFDVVAGVTSPPTDISVVLDGRDIPMARDDSGAWAGDKQLNLGESTALDFRATGLPNAPWTLTLTFSNPESGGQTVNFKKDGKIPVDTLISILQDNINLRNGSPLT